MEQEAPARRGANLIMGQGEEQRARRSADAINDDALAAGPRCLHMAAILIERTAGIVVDFDFSKRSGGAQPRDRKRRDALGTPAVPRPIFRLRTKSKNPWFIWLPGPDSNQRPTG